MGQVIDIGNLIRLKVYFSLIGAATLFGIGLFVLSRNRKAAVNQLFAAGMLALAVGDAAWFASAHSSSPSILLLWQRIILASHIVMLPAQDEETDPEQRRCANEGEIHLKAD